MALCLQLPEGGLAGGAVFEQADFKQFLAPQFLARVAEQLSHEGIGVENSSRRRIHQQHAVVSRFEEPPVAQFRAPQLGLIRQDFGDVPDAQEDCLRLATGFIERTAIEQQAAAANPFKVVRDLEVVEGIV